MFIFKERENEDEDEAPWLFCSSKVIDATLAVPYVTRKRQCTHVSLSLSIHASIFSSKETSSGECGAIELDATTIPLLDCSKKDTSTSTSTSTHTHIHLALASWFSLCRSTSPSAIRGPLAESAQAAATAC